MLHRHVSTNRYSLSSLVGRFPSTIYIRVSHVKQLLFAFLCVFGALFSAHVYATCCKRICVVNILHKVHLLFIWRFIDGCTSGAGIAYVFLEYLSLPPLFVACLLLNLIFSFLCSFYRSLFVSLTLFFWPLYCISFWLSVIGIFY